MRRASTLLLVLGLLSGGSGQAAPVTVNIPAAGDLALGRSDVHRNRGEERVLELKNSGHERILVEMDREAIRRAVGAGKLRSATLEMEIVASDRQLGSGTRIDVHPLTRLWYEGNGTRNGATWTCANDTNLSNLKSDCAAGDGWDLSGGAPPWGPVSAAVTVVAHQTGVVRWDVTADVAAWLSGRSSFGWAVKKNREDANGSISFAAREQGASGPRLVLTIEPPVVGGGWIRWGGTAGDSFTFPILSGPQATLKLDSNRVLWTGKPMGDDSDGLLRLFATDPENQTVRLLTEARLTELMPEFMAGRVYQWYNDKNLFRQADGSVVLFFADDWDRGVCIVTLDVDDAGIRVRGTPAFLDRAAFPPLDNTYIGFYKAAVTPVADGQFLIAYIYHPDVHNQIDLNLRDPQPAGLSLYGHAWLAGGNLMLAEAGDESGVAVWELDIVEGQAGGLVIEGANAGFRVTIDRQPGSKVIDPFTIYPPSAWDSGASYYFQAPYTGKAYAKLMPSSSPGSTATISALSVWTSETDRLSTRRLDLTSGTPVMGAAVPVPGDGVNGYFMGINGLRLDTLDADRVLMHLNTVDPTSRQTRGMTRVVTTTAGGLAFGDLIEVLPGPDFPFSTAVNTDTLVEGIVASVVFDFNTNNEPYVGPFDIAGNRITPHSQRILESARGFYDNQITYLGNNEYLLAQQINFGWDENGIDLIAEQHLFVLRTDGLGNITEQAGPFVTPGMLGGPRLQVLDQDHVLLTWRTSRSGPEGPIEELAAKILYKH